MRIKATFSQNLLVGEQIEANRPESNFSCINGFPAAQGYTEDIPYRHNTEQHNYNKEHHIQNIENLGSEAFILWQQQSDYSSL